MTVANIAGKENFQSGTISLSKWNNWGGAQCVAKSDRLEISTLLTAVYYGMDSKDSFDLTGSNVSVEVVNVGNQALVSLEVTPIQLQVDASNIIFFLISGNILYAFKKVAGVQTSVASVAYNSTTQRYLRIRESGGTIYWDYSADRGSWTNLTTLANPFAVTVLTFTFSAGTYAAEATATTIIYDNLNIIGKETPGNIDRGVSTGQGMSVAT